MTRASPAPVDDAPLTEAELELIDALADWQARRDFARLAANAPRPLAGLSGGKEPANGYSDT